MIIQNKGVYQYYDEVKIAPESLARLLASRENQEVIIAGLKIAEISHVTATATGNVITVKLYLKS